MWKRGAESTRWYRISHDRLDFYVTKAEFKRAFLAVQSLGSKNEQGQERVLEVRIFAGVRVVLLYETAFGKAQQRLRDMNVPA